MFSFLSEFTRDVDRPHTVIVMDDEGLEQPRQYRVVPRNLFLLLGGVTLVVTFLVVLLVALTPLRELIPGYGTAELRQNARLNALRVAALQDSLDAQQHYMTRLRQLMMGDVDSVFSADVAEERPEPAGGVSGELAEVAAPPRSQDWADHEQPALPVARMPAAGARAVRVATTDVKYLASLQLPVLAPVDGFVTRGFDARTGHYAVDIAVEEGTTVQSIGDGYVIFADWTHEGGHAVAVQHADGYVSVYKHNQRLLKRVGDRVRARDPIAISGNAGEITTGPHLHFELWHEGLAQDPRYFFVGN